MTDEEGSGGTSQEAGTLCSKLWESTEGVS